MAKLERLGRWWREIREVGGGDLVAVDETPILCTFPREFARTMSFVLRGQSNKTPRRADARRLVN